MNKPKKYETIIGLLLLAVILQWVFILISRPKKVSVPRLVPAPAAAVKGRIAIVIDDWGYNLDNLPMLDEIQYPLTASILPNLPYSRTVAREMHKRGKEVILHLPMEPREKFRLENNTLMTTFGREQMRNIIARDLANVIYAKGVSNHMGSLATEDSRTMSVLFQELKKRRLYFLDSFVTSRSVGRDLAHKMNLDFAKRDIFLDNSPDPAYIRGQIYKLKIKAKVYGYAIGIGHDRKNTLQVLKSIMPEFEKEGYRFVFVSELAQ